MKITIFIILIIMLLIYLFSNKKEQFSIVYPFYNPYYPYTNPYSQCVEDIYGNTRCYAPNYFYRYNWPRSRKYPFRRFYRKY